MSRVDSGHDRTERWPEPVTALVLTAVLIAVSAVAAHVTRQPLVFASLGPTVYLLVESPLTARASPYNTLVGHLAAILIGWASLVVTGLRTSPPATEVAVDGARIAAIVLALSVTAAVILLLDASHPPAAATALLIALGTLRRPDQLLAMAAGVPLLTVAGLVLNRARGLPVVRLRGEVR